MFEHEPTNPFSWAETSDGAPAGAESDETPPDKSTVERSRRPRRRWSRLEIIDVAISLLLAIAVVVLALNMKFEADQARWQQRQTCLAWYQLQADYGLGPWYQQLPEAAADCGGGVGDDGNPLVPGGSLSAVEPGEDRYVPGG